ncbi:hypothetical protein PMV_089 [Port-miou virus]|uniref:MORN repeat-containing protein n=1 Tax=Port-miou virus TaxID=1733873 RepID=A0A0N9PU91_9VIRU|nr:hypothetical protein PMV_089 [Port-miou virus]
MFVFLKKRDAAAFYISTGDDKGNKEFYRVRVKKGDSEYCLLPDGTRDGEYKEFWQTGKIKYKYFYSLGQLHKKSYEWNEEGVLVDVSTFQNGKRVHQKSWYDNGLLKRDGKKRWHSNGRVRYDDGKTWDKDGKLLGEFRDGSGKKFEWYAHGDKIMSQTEWKDGQKHGLSITFREDGTYLNIQKYFEGKYLENYRYQGKKCRQG